MRPSIDHGILSPSGKVSGRSRKAALDRMSAELFPPGFWERPKPDPIQEQKDYLVRRIAECHKWEELGFRPRVMKRERMILETKLDALEKL